MPNRRTTIAIGALVFLLIAQGCSAVDSFEPRALAYNRSAGELKGNTIFANILRASAHRPLQFTEYTSATAQTNLSGQIAATIPVAVIPQSVTRSFGINPQLNAGLQTQATVQNLNSQEFYNGLQTPLSDQMLGTFAQLTHDPRFVFMIAVDDIKISNGTAIEYIQNDPSDYNRMASYWSAINLLLTAGLTFETAQAEARPVGPPMTPLETKLFMPDYYQAQARAAAADATNKIPELKQVGKNYQLSKSASSYRICFLKSQMERFNGYLGSKDGANYILHLKLSTTLSANREFDIKVPASQLCGASTTAKSNTKEGFAFNLDFTNRSVEQIYSYIGQLVRTQIRDPSAYSKFRIPNADGSVFYKLFDVKTGYLPGATYSASLDGNVYSIVSQGFDDGDRSTDVISLLSDLWSLEYSAKSFPASNTFTVVNQ